MRLLVVSILFLCTGFVSFSETSDSLLYELDQTITKQPEYVKQKWARIGTLRKELNSATTQQQKFDINSALFEEFKSFIYDSAFAYSSKLLLTAYSLRNESLINASKVKISFTLLSAGMFKEALDTLHSIDSAALTREAKIEFYSAYARTYFDMGQYAQDQ
ncbi:MAG: tetratricopeptide repeat protein, partial [Cytophagales bacterium]|nr:tetratricopeptide repeat protein [Cytophaga sp.]